MKDFSQSGEQAIILKYFGDFRGTVLDIGANDGILYSNSRALVELDWSAVLVEPAEIAFGKLMANNLIFGSGKMPEGFAGTPADFHAMISGGLVVAPNGRVKCVQAAITTTDGPLTFYSSGTHLKKGDTDLLSTTHPEELARWKKSGEQFTKTTVRGITFQTLMDELGLLMIRDDKLPGIMKAHYDFISIDAEGADLEILRQIDLTAVGCRLLCVEVNQRGDAEFTEYAKRHGMRLLWSCYENRIYAR